MRLFLKRQWYFWREVLKRFYHDGCSHRAAALSFTSLLSLVPLMALGLSVLTAFPNFKHVADSVQDFIFRHFVVSSGKIIQTYMQTFVSQVSQLSLFGLIMLFFAAILMMFTLEQALNHIWRIKQQRHGVAAFLLYWAVLTISPVLLGSSLVVSSYVASWRFFSETVVHLSHFNPVLLLTPFLLSAGAFTLLYVAVPNCKVPIKYGVISGVFSAALFEVGKKGFAYYLSQFSSYQMIYGALSSIPIFLLWVYVCWLITLLGAEFCHALTMNYFNKADFQSVDPFTHIYRWLGHFWQAQMRGHSLSLTELVRIEPLYSGIEPEELLHHLLKVRLIHPTIGGRYILARDLSHLRFGELQVLLPWRMPRSGSEVVFNDLWEQHLQQALLTIEEKTALVSNHALLNFYRGHAKSFLVLT